MENKITQICYRCKIEKNLDAFAYRKDRSEYRKTCIECERGKHFKSRYSISREEYDILLKNQNDLCKACGEPPLEGKFLHVDHIKDTQIIRGLIHLKCNTAIGHANDDPEMLRKLALYLENKDTFIGKPSIKGQVYNIRSLVGYKGVYKNHGKYGALIHIEKKKDKHLGTFEYPEQAALAYNKAALELYGPNTYLNDVDLNWIEPNKINSAKLVADF